MDLNKILILVRDVFYLIISPFFIFYSFFIPKRHTHYIWCPVPIINNKYWSESVRATGRSTLTLMEGFYSINRREDFDLYYDDLVPSWIPGSKVRSFLQPLLAFCFVIKNAQVIHIPFSGGPLGNLPSWRLEALCMRLAGIKVIILPYGGDYQMYSSLIDLSWKYGLIHSYPEGIYQETIRRKKITYWVKNADCIIPGFQFDGIGRWDCIPYAIYIIDTGLWPQKTEYSMNDGINGPVRLVHTPNHRGCKGTEYVIDAVKRLQGEGLLVELLLLEKISNEEIRKIMPTVDILVDQLLMGYALSAIEGLSTGLPVLSNLENERITRVFRRFSYLNECPIVSSSPENIVDNLRILIKNPGLRREIGCASRMFAEKYHSYKTGEYIFGSVYSKILDGKDLDLMNMFHPLLSDYVRQTPLIRHPLVENRLKEPEESA